MLLSLLKALENTNIILASGSPRRHEILKNSGLKFRVEISGADEDNSLESLPDDLALSHARLKGNAVAEQFPESLVISADTVVVCQSEIMGKPADERDAYQMLQKLSGNTHQVITAYGLIYKKYNQVLFKTVTTDVTFHKLTDMEINAYIKTGEPFDKAGAYAIQGQAAIFIEKIDGCYYNVMGFPISDFYKTLETFLQNLPANF